MNTNRSFILLILISCVCSLSYGQQAPQAPSLPKILPEELVELQADTDLVILDTRSPEEYEQGHLENARFVNYETFRLEDVADLSKEQKIIVYCKKGGRSDKVSQQLIDAGYKRVKSLTGGITAWQEKGYPTRHD